MLNTVKRRFGAYVGDRKFYREAIAISVPIMVQMGITNFVNLLDNIMVGALGTESISGVAIVNQFMFIFNLVIFGSISAAGIFTAQFFGNGDIDGVRHTFRFKMIINTALGILGVVVFILFQDTLINLFIHEADDGANLALTVIEAKSYLAYTVIGIIPYAIAQAYASTLKETRNTVVPMVSSLVAVFTNLALNAILIYGLLGLPEMGVAGAAIATSVSRFLELIILLVWAHTHSNKATFIKGAYRSLAIPRELIKRISLKGLPILVNECLWACAITMRTQCYSTTGTENMAAASIASTVFNVFSVVFYSLGTAVAIMVGNRLGSGDTEDAKNTSRKMIAFAVFVSVIVGVIVFAFSPLFPKLYDMEDTTRGVATYMLMVLACLMPITAFANSTYYTIRSGGRVFITMLMDSGFMWAVVVPTSVILAYATPLSIFWIYPICQGTEIIKVIIGAILLKKSNWARSLMQ
jgi:putative MATE family efflux protein